MRAIPATLAPLGLALALLTGCGGQGGAGDSAPAADNGTPAAQLADSPTAAPSAAPQPSETREGKAVDIKSQDDDLEFAYSWPAQANAIVPLDQWLQEQAAAKKKAQEASAREDAAQAKTGGYPFHGHSFQQSWTVTADTPQFLVMEANGYEYTGGAHGLPFVASLIWDKTAGKRLAIGDVLDVSGVARIAHDRFCTALDAERAKKRGGAGGSEGLLPEFTRCVDLAKQEVVPVSRDGRAIDALRIVILPYEAGPYAEGTYEVVLPVDAALLAAVKPAWKGAFAAG